MKPLFKVPVELRQDCIAMSNARYNIFPDEDMSQEEFFEKLCEKYDEDELASLFSRITMRNYTSRSLSRFYRKFEIVYKPKKQKSFKEMYAYTDNELELIANKREYYENMRKKFNGAVSLKLAVRQRDNNCCVHCGRSGKYVQLHIHHINGLYSHPEQGLDMENLATLCEECHNEFHSIYGHGKTCKITFKQFDEWQLSVM